MTRSEFNLVGDHVTLGQLLKLTGIIGSGGEAKQFLSETPPNVNGEPESRRGRKLRAGDTVTLDKNNVIEIVDDQPGPGVDN